MSSLPPTGNNPIAAPQTEFAPPVGEPMPAPGALHIKEKRAWKTWQLVVGMALAALVGMAVSYSPGGASGSSSSSAPAYKLPVSGGSTSTTAAGGTTTTTAAGSGTTTTTETAGSTTTTTPVAAQPPRVLVGPTQMTGNWTSPAFTITASTWNIGWAFQCTPAPASGPSFQVYAVPAGKSPSGTPAISETGASGQSVTAQSATGSQTLVVQAPASCTWVVKVTGS